MVKRTFKILTLYFFTMIFISACASSPQEMRGKPPYYEVNLDKSIVDAISCVSKSIDEIDVKFSDPIEQNIKYLPNSEDGTIYLSSAQASNIALIDFYKGVKTSVQLRYNSNVMVFSDNLKDAIMRCK